jgi:hypothetical protein
MLYTDMTYSVANATADLIMMGVMSVLTDHFDADPIPTWYFARDDRVQKAFFDRCVCSLLSLCYEH